MKSNVVKKILSFARLDNYWFLLICGILFGWAFAPAFFIPGAFAIGVLISSSAAAKSARSALLYGFAFGMGWFMASVGWMANSVLIYSNETILLWPVIFLGMPLVLSCFPALASCSAWLAKGLPIPYRITFSCIFIFFEWLRSWIFTGLPWNMPAHILAFSDILIQSISVFGSLGVSFVVIYTLTSVFYIIQGRTLWFFKSLGMAFITILIAAIFGMNRLDSPVNDTDINIRLVQLSTKQSSKWSFRDFKNEFDKYIDFSSATDFASNDPSIVIWPESAIILPISDPYIDGKLREMMKTWQNKDVALITGTIEKLDGKYYVAMKSLDSAGKRALSYRKNHLVPFGEYIPAFARSLGVPPLTEGGGYHSRGAVDNVISVLPAPFNLKIQPIICYEAAFPAQLKHVTTANTDVIVNVTNDSWYGKSAGPYQHLHIARMRSIERGIPMVRAATNGISAIIDGYGRIVSKTKLDQVGILDGKLPAKSEKKTIYSIIGDLGIFFLMILAYIIERFIICRTKE